MAKVKPRVINMDNNTTNAVINGTSTSTAYTWPWSTDYYNVPYCEHRLPCGYCKLLQKDCPQKSYTITYCNGAGSPVYTKDGPTCINTTSTIKSNNITAGATTVAM